MQQHTVKHHPLSHKKTHLIGAAVILACGLIAPQAQATLVAGSILKFNAGVLGGYYGNAVISGSYFGMDTNGDGVIKKTERTPIKQNAGLTLGSVQAASGSHSGAADGTESPGIDAPWSFFGNTGLHYTLTKTNVLSASGNTATVDFSGWGVTWNGIAAINMGGGAWAGNANGVATVTCAVACANGDTYTLDYSATVPVGDPSGFGGVKYNLHLEGTILVPRPLTASIGSLAAGSFAASAGSTDGRMTMADLTSTTNGNAGKKDTGYTYGGSLYDFKVTSVTSPSVKIMIPLSAAIPANAVYRKYANGAWSTFTADSTNLLASAAKVSGTCPAVGNSAYDATKGLVAGDDCLQLTIVDNGPYDDNAATGTVADPGGIATAIVKQVDTRTWGTSGCSMSQSPVDPTQRADWWLVAGFFVALGWLRRKRHAK